MGYLVGLVHSGIISFYPVVPQMTITIAYFLTIKSQKAHETLVEKVVSRLWLDLTTKSLRSQQLANGRRLSTSPREGLEEIEKLSINIIFDKINQY